MATAKGLCYALNIPLITESTLKVMARAAVEIIAEKNVLLCPMIDARRMEVFTAVYDIGLKEILRPQPMILDEHSFTEMVGRNKILFFGSGSDKFKSLMQHGNASFAEVQHHAGHLSYLSYAAFRAGIFTDLAYAEPVYLKEFYTHTRK
jgi:tRNA threonylcarbamoyladenosine biosynthesis protein TsaB